MLHQVLEHSLPLLDAGAQSVAINVILDLLRIESLLLLRHLLVIHVVILVKILRISVARLELVV